MKKIPRTFYDRSTITVAKELLGKYLVRVQNGVEQIGRIVETEAYIGPQDLASHSSRGLTQRTKIMFGPPGYAYVYMIYGIYYCLNIVTKQEGQASAVLIRAIEPVQAIDERTQGPGLLCKAMSIDKQLNGCDLTMSNYFYLAEKNDTEIFSIVRRPRIGISYAKHWAMKPLRFYIKDNLFVSKR